MSDKIRNNINLLAAIFAITGVSIIGVYKWLKTTEPIIYKGSVQDNNTNKYIAGAKITFLGYQNEIQTCKTDDSGLFYAELSKEYPMVEIEITHNDYKPIRQNKKLTKAVMETPQKFYLVPIIEQSIEIKPPDVKQEETTKIIEGGSNKKEEEIEGESGYQLTKKWALEEAEKDAYNKLKRRLNKSSFAYEIKKDSVWETEHDGWKATVVIFTYK